MVFLLVLIGIAVVWLVVKQNRRSEDQQQIQNLQWLVDRLEQRMSAVERAASAPQARSGPQLPPKSTEQVLRPVVQKTFPPDLSPYRAKSPPAETPVQVFLEPISIAAPIASALPFVQAVTAQGSPEAPPPLNGRMNEEPSQWHAEPLVTKSYPSLEERLGANWLNKLGSSFWSSAFRSSCLSAKNDGACR